MCVAATLCQQLLLGFEKDRSHLLLDQEFAVYVNLGHVAVLRDKLVWLKDGVSEFEHVIDADGMTSPRH